MRQSNFEGGIRCVVRGIPAISKGTYVFRFACWVTWMIVA
jgi:hypothetical protein